MKTLKLQLSPRSALAPTGAFDGLRDRTCPPGRSQAKLQLGSPTFFLSLPSSLTIISPLTIDNPPNKGQMPCIWCLRVSKWNNSIINKTHTFCLPNGNSISCFKYFLGSLKISFIVAEAEICYHQLNSLQQFVTSKFSFNKGTLIFFTSGKCDLLTKKF